MMGNTQNVQNFKKGPKGNIVSVELKPLAQMQQQQQEQLSIALQKENPSEMQPAELGPHPWSQAPQDDFLNDFLKAEKSVKI